MKRSGLNGMYFISSLLFLLVLVAKPLHQLTHLTDHSQITQNDFDTNEANLISHDFCNLCDFQIPSPLESAKQILETKSEFTIFKKPFFSYPSSFTNDFSERIKKLRAPPLLD